MPTESDRDNRSQRHQMDALLRRYGADKWGEGFVRVNEEGNLVFLAPGLPPVDLHALALTLDRCGARAPFVVRFPTMIERQMDRLHRAFLSASKEYGYAGRQIGVYPIKVNQRRAVVDAVVKARERFDYGLEAGSKPELLLAMAQPPAQHGLIVCNGFKDHEYFRLAFHAAELGHKVIVVMESVHEIARFIEVATERAWKRQPQVGMRAKLYSGSSGPWQSIGGNAEAFRAKFGLTTNEILEVVRRLKAAGKLDLLSLLHFHIGSQITQIRRVKQAVREGIYLWASLRKICPSLQYLDVGGGIGVDYDGSRTSNPSSANYTIEEYANHVVFEVMEVSSSMGLPPPTLVKESGRVLVADHAVTVAELREVQGVLLPFPEESADEHRLIRDLRYTLAHISTKNIEEYFHDALDRRDEALQLFSSGYLSLEERAKAEGLFQGIELACMELMHQLDRMPEDIRDHLRRPRHMYLVNFSVFQSLPDSWSVGHVFPAAPLSGHRKQPEVNAQLVDLTCDSYGCIKAFAHPEKTLDSLSLHDRSRGDPKYFLGFFMTGAYQDNETSYHNLLSRTHEVIVHALDDPPLLAGSERIEFAGCYVEVKRGLTNVQILEGMDLDEPAITGLLECRHRERETSLGHGWTVELLRRYPYLIE